MSTLPRDNEYIVWLMIVHSVQCSTSLTFDFFKLFGHTRVSSLEFFAANFCHQSPKTESSPLQVFFEGKKGNNSIVERN
jgi:hypothetical protein